MPPGYESDGLPFIWWHSFGFLHCVVFSDLARDVGPTVSTLGETELFCVDAEVIRGIIFVCYTSVRASDVVGQITSMIGVKRG
jgi:hypothetical protein